MAIKALINRFNLRSSKDKQIPDPPSSSSADPSTSRSTLVTRRPLSAAQGPPIPTTHFNPYAPPDLDNAPSPRPAPGDLPTPTDAGSSSSHSVPPTQQQKRAAAAEPPAGGSKRVAFLSPPPTPGGLFPTRPLPDRSDSDEGPPTSGPRRRGNSFSGEAGRASQDGHGPAAGGAKGSTLKQRTYSNPGQPEGRTSFASVSRITGTRSRQGQPFSPLPSTPPADAGAFSLRSGTPYSHMSGRSFVQAATSWSEAAEEDLVSNLGPRERTRQEVLWEIVTSEERYVAELLKMKETFIDPLLHPFTAPVPVGGAPTSSPPSALSPLPLLPSAFPTVYESDAEDHHPPSNQNHQRQGTPGEDSLEYLPIAARFLSPTASPLLEADLEATPSSEEGEYAPQHPEQDWRRATVTSNHRSPYGTSSPPTRGGSGSSRGRSPANNVPFPTRSHASLPPPPRLAASTSTASLGRHDHPPQRSTTAQDTHPSHPSAPTPRSASGGTSTPASRVMRKLQKPRTPSDSDVPKGIAPQALPEDLRECLSVLERGVLPGHVALCEGLRRRYEEQYPLVRSLADVFVSHSHILREYATYVLHLERALEQVDAFLATDVKKKPKKQEVVEWMRISRILQRLEDVAADKGETGLAICLSKPFQRLLKYPLLFQNLLFHTDPSTYEYESTLLMVAEVETIVRSIEDEKILKEERDRTRDAMARIEGLERDRLLGAPKSSRMLVEEKAYDEKAAKAKAAALANGEEPAKEKPPVQSAEQQKTVKQKSSFRRLSEHLPGNSSSSNPPTLGSKKDLWLVVFNDVVLRCQRTGVTTLPLASGTPTQGGTKSASAPDLAGKGKYATVGKRASHTRPRNLYKFLKVETWEVVETARAGIVSMEDIGRSRAQLTEEAVAALPTATGAEEEDAGAESDESDRKSKMSFSYWGADKITIQRKPGSSTGPSTPSSRGRGTAPRRPTPGLATRDSSANAKFGTRLRSPEGHHPPSAHRPVSRQHAPGVVRRGTNSSEDTGTGKSLQARPPWGSNLQNLARTAPAKRPTPAGAAPPAIPGAKAEPNAGAAATAAGKETEPPTVRSTKYSSTAPSEDSGVGLYKAVIAANPSINKLSMV